MHLLTTKDLFLAIKLFLFFSCFGTEKSQDYAHMVHRLLSQYTQGEPDWVKKYPTDSHVPKVGMDEDLQFSVFNNKVQPWVCKANPFLTSVSKGS